MTCEFFDYSILREEVCEEDLILFDEIITCIENEVYRSASILIWVSVLESLLRKLNILKIYDREIKKTINDFNKNINEKDLLLKCKTHGLISQIEHSKLDSIREARNNYAHPNEESPSKEDVLVDLRYAVEYVLSKPTLYSKNSAKNELRELLNDPNFLGNPSDNQINEYALTFTKKIISDDFKEIIEKLFKMIEDKFNEKDANNQKPIKHGLIYAKTLLSNNTDSINETSLNNLITKSKITSCHIFADNTLWDYLDSRSKGRIFNYSIDLEIFSEKEFINRFNAMYEKLDDDSKLKFNEYTEKTSVELLMNTNLSIDKYFNRIIKIFKSHDYYKIIPIANKIKNMDLSEFNENQLEILGENILNEAENNSYASQDLIKQYKYTDIPLPLLRGFLNRSFINEQDELFFKGELFQTVLNILNKQTNPEIIFDELLNKIKITKPHMNPGIYEDIIENLEQYSFIDLQKEKLIEAINQSRCNFINNNVKELLSIDSQNFLVEYLDDCLNDKNKKEFIKLFDEEPMKFLKYFTTIKYERFAKIKNIIILDELFNFIKKDEIILKLSSFDPNDLNPIEKRIYNKFTE